jgi:PST family polysaccharide transporter
MNQFGIKSLPLFVRNSLNQRPNLRRIVGNVGWLSVDRILRLAVGLVVSVWVARYLGPEQFGQLNYAVVFAFMFGALATLGLDGIVVRDIVHYPASRNEILGTAFGLKLAGGSIAVLTSVMGIVILRSGEPLTQWIVGIVAGGMVFQALDTIDLWFQSQVQSRYAVMAKSSAFLVLSIAKIVLIKMQAPLIAFAWAGLAEIVVGAVGLVLAYRLRGLHFRDWSFRFVWVVKLLTDSWPLFLSGVAIMIYMKIGTVMLGQMAGDKAVGIYSAALRISELWYFVPIAVISSMAPRILELKKTNETLYYKRLQQSFDLMAVLAYAVALPVTFLAKYIVLILYGQAFQASGIVLVIHIWQAVFVFLGVAFGTWFVAEGLTKAALVTTGCGAIVNVLLNIWLIPRYGAVGAALASVAAMALAGYGCFVLIPYKPFRKLGGMLTHAIILHFVFQRINSE